MITDPYTIVLSGDDAVFSKKKSGESSSEWINQATTNAEPERLLLSHAVQTTKGTTVKTDQHTVTATRAEKDSESGFTHQLSVSLNIRVPQSGQFSQAEVLREIEKIYSFLTADTNANMAKILRGES